MKKGIFTRAFVMLCVLCAFFFMSAGSDRKEPARKILFIGDSMTGWLAERLNAYGEENGFEVSTVVWDGSTISKWGRSPKFAELVKKQNPDAVFISLGMNELFELHPDRKLKGAVENIRHAIGDRPLLWVGPPSWPGHDGNGKVLNDWLEKELGDSLFYRSSGLKIPRQSPGNPHPTRAGMVAWIDSVVSWMPEHAAVTLPGIKKPEGARMSRGKHFIYKRMKENL